MSSTCLVTGGTGFVGSHLVDALLERGWQVRCLVRSPERARTLAARGVELCQGDLRDEASLARATRGVGYIFHVAGRTSAVREADYHESNVRATDRLLRACARRPDAIERVVVVSSLAASGPAADGIPRTELSPCRPVSAYGRSKLRAELVTRAWMARLPCTIVRPPVVYGPRDTEGLLVYRAIRAGFSPRLPGARRLSLVHAQDLAHGMLLAARQPEAMGRTYFLTGGDAELDTVLDLIAAALGQTPRRIAVPPALLELAALLSEAVARALGTALTFHRGKAMELRQPAWLCSGERAARELGFQPRWKLDEGIAQTVRWYLAAGWL